MPLFLFYKLSEIHNTHIIDSSHGTMTILGRVRQKHASDDVIYHALYAHYYCKLSVHRIALYFGKNVNTIRNWIKRYEDEGIVGRHPLAPAPSSFTMAERIWIKDYYKSNPTKYLREAASDFNKAWGKYINKTMVYALVR